MNDIESDTWFDKYEEMEAKLSATIAAQAAEIAALREALEEIATSHNHLTDEAMEEVHGTVAMAQRRFAARALKGK